VLVLQALLVAVIVLSVLTYAAKPFTFATDEAEILNKRQKIANLVGAGVAIVIVFIIWNSQ